MAISEASSPVVHVCVGIIDRVRVSLFSFTSLFMKQDEQLLIKRLKPLYVSEIWWWLRNNSQRFFQGDMFFIC